jgi:uncharacterized protein YkwD
VWIQGENTLLPRPNKRLQFLGFNRRILMLSLILLGLTLPAGLTACFSPVPTRMAVTESLAVTEASAATTSISNTQATTPAAMTTTAITTSATTSIATTTATSTATPATHATSTAAVTTAGPTPAATTRATTTAITPSGSLSASEWIAAILAATNAARVAHGLVPLTAASAELAQAAAIRGDEIAQVFSHTRPDDRTCFTALDDCGVAYSCAAENIAYATTGYYDPQKVVDAWMASSGHRANILNSSYTSLGIGYARSDGKEYFVQLFIG